VTRASVIDDADRLEAGGVVVARESATIASRLLAPIIVVRVRAGDAVRAGDVLITLDARDLSAQARQASSTVAAAEQALVRARSEQRAAVAEQALAAAWHRRVTTLRDRNSATPQEFDEAEARLAGANQRVAAATAGVDQSQATLDASRAGADAATTTQSFAVIRAPFAGVITERLIDPGNLATPGAPLLRMDGNDGRRVEARVDESRARFLRSGDRVQVALASTTSPDADDVVDATVDEVARAVAADQRAFTVKVTLPAGIAPRTGSFARVRFAGAPRRALVVPAAAVRRNGQVASVFVVADGVARLRLVQLGDESSEHIEIRAGLDAGEAVVAPVPPTLTDGRKVTIVGSRADVGDRR
jgi:RND family efflux transporter MFP subunit